MVHPNISCYYINYKKIIESVRVFSICSQNKLTISVLGYRADVSLVCYSGWMTGALGPEELVLTVPCAYLQGPSQLRVVSLILTAITVIQVSCVSPGWCGSFG